MHTAKKICLPEDITGLRVQQAFEGFMRDYPKTQNSAELDHGATAFIVGLALLRAFPCPGASAPGVSAR
jgi:hypothetical protein